MLVPSDPDDRFQTQQSLAEPHMTESNQSIAGTEWEKPASFGQ